MTFEHMHFTDNYYITKNERNTLGEEWIPTYCNWTSKNTDAHAYTNIVYPSGADVRSKFRSGFSNLKLRLSLEFICMCINIYLSLSPSPLLKEFNKATLIMYVCMYVCILSKNNKHVYLKVGYPKIKWSSMRFMMNHPFCKIALLYTPFSDTPIYKVYHFAGDVSHCISIIPDYIIKTLL